ncbi:peptidase inhibitor family I36 protein [Streptomyces uncialis]|uniref:peptidase inhibitor family I36 protein n=1 Tax=Streptomyces uncialis TaxID=1048205 RepID=UPI0038669A53|nr:peptidase inhibitor family I36 protein [Streptomyces uncialis]
MWRRTATAIATMVLTATGIAVAPAASAAEACPAGKLCLYSSTGFVNMKFQTGSVNTCWELAFFGLDSVRSYVNNMNGYARFYSQLIPPKKVWEIRDGGSSSNSTTFTGELYVCTD